MSKKQQRLQKKQQQQEQNANTGGGVLSKKELRQLQYQEAAERKKNERIMKKKWREEKRKRTYGDAEWKSDFLKFSDQLTAIGLMIKDVAGDGNCLFRAMADQFTGEPSNYATYRKQICEFILYNRQDYEPFIEDDEPFDEYIARMRKNGTWGGHLEIQACSMAYQVNVTIHQLNQPRWELTYPGFATKTIHLSYHDGQHYSSVRMLGDNSRNGHPEPIEMKTGRPNTNKEKKESDIFIPVEEELIVMDHTGCTNLAFIRQVLLDNYGDIESTVEYIFIVGPDNEEIQREYLEKFPDPSLYQKSNTKETSSNDITKERKNQNQDQNLDNPPEKKLQTKS